jgi:ATP-dependent Zn protease
MILREHLEADLDGADLSPVAKRLLGGTGADAERAVRGARRRARHAGRLVGIDDLLAEVRGKEGAPKPSRRTAIHESGHAVVVAETRRQDILSLSVQRTDGHLGGMLMSDQDGVDSTEDGITRLLQELLAGRAAEEAIYGQVSGGSGGSSASDLARATLLAVSSDLSWGLGETLVWHGHLTSDDVGRLISLRPDVAMRAQARLTAAYAQTLAMIRERRRAVEALADELLAREVLSGDEVRAVLASVAPETPPPPEPVRRLGTPARSGR